MNIKYLDENGNMVTIANVLWFSFVSLPIDFQIVYYLVGDDERHELMLPFGTPVLADTLS